MGFSEVLLAELEIVRRSLICPGWFVQVGVAAEPGAVATG